jgi:DNA-directed RNA polymerase specialized sigma24 family protein
MAARETIRPLGSTQQSDAAPCGRSFGGGDSDADLFRDAAQGNAAAFEKIACRYDQAILAFLLALTGSEQAALDLCHSTLLTAYREMQRRRAQSMYIWFYRLAADQWLAWTGNHARDAQNPPAPAGPTPAEALGALSARERLVFALKTNQRLALQTVAQILDLPEETVVRIFTRTVAKLRMAHHRDTR